MNIIHKAIYIKHYNYKVRYLRHLKAPGINLQAQMMDLRFLNLLNIYRPYWKFVPDVRLHHHTYTKKRENSCVFQMPHSVFFHEIVLCDFVQIDFQAKVNDVFGLLLLFAICTKNAQTIRRHIFLKEKLVLCRWM